jgi:NAD-dependent SIR2 family protein deacetylase
MNLGRKGDLRERLGRARSVAVLTGAGVSAESGVPLSPDAIRDALKASESCDILLVVGMSALVHPAASLPMLGKHHGAYVVEVNLGPTPLTSLADESHHGKAGEILPRLLGLHSALCNPHSAMFEDSREDACSP